MIKNLLVVALLFVGTMVFAQPGSNDPTFNIVDNGILGDGSGFNGTVYSTSIQADGKIMVGGRFTSFNGTSAINRIVRINAEGFLDNNFTTGMGFDNDVHSIAIQSDGKMIVGGDFTSFNGTSAINRIVRLNADGSRDNTFNTSTGFNSSVHLIAIQSDGKIIVGGQFTSFNGTTGINRIVRLNADGSLDTSFNAGTGFDSTVYSIAIQSDGKMIVGGAFTSFNGVTGISHIVRLNNNGSLDATFNSGTGFDNVVRSTTIQSDGKIIVGGAFTAFNGTTGVNRIVRLNTTGTRDTSFNTGTGFDNSVYSTSIQADGKIILGGNFTFFNGTIRMSRIARLNTNGTYDNTFNIGAGFSSAVYSTTIQSDGKIMVVGDFFSFNGLVRIGNIIRLNATGARDITFNKGTGFNHTVYSTSIQADGKIIVGGHFSSFNGTLGINSIVRLNANGSRDTSFNAGAGFDGLILTTSIQADGKIIVGGGFVYTKGSTQIYNIARLNADGSLDTTFDSRAGINSNDIVRSTAIQSDGKIMVGGGFTSSNGTSIINGIVRLNANGTRDTTFNPGSGIGIHSGADYAVESIVIQADGKIILGGQFTSFDGTPDIKYIVRLNANGSRDTSFNAGTGFNGTVKAIAIQSDGKIMVGGYFTSFNGINGINRLIRLNANGSQDPGFNIGYGFNSAVHSISIQADGKMIVGGLFTSFNGTPEINRIVRLNVDGLLDTSFNAGTGFNGTVHSTSIQADGKIIAGGDFTSFSGIARNRLARLRASACTPATFSTQNVTVCNAYKWLANGAIFTSSGTYTVTLANAAGCDSIVTLNLTINQTPVLTTSVNGVTITADETGATYQWIDCNNANAPIAGETSQSFTATTNGNYAVIVTKNTCSDTSACVAITKVGVNKIEALHSNFQVFPNPNNGTFSLQTNSSELGKISITNALGELVFSEITKAPKAEINLSQLGSGIYVVEVVTNGSIGRQKIIISK